MLRAGTRLGEADQQMPGDDLIPSPNIQITRAVDINVPPHAVWTWIAQMGRDGTGFYGLDFLTNRSVPSVAYLRRDLPTPTEGLTMDHGYRILAVETDTMFLYGAFDLPTPI